MIIIKLLLALIKIILLILISLGLESICLVVLLFTAPFGYRLQSGAYVARIWGYLNASALLLNVKSMNKIPKHKNGLFLISNHLSYLDIPVIFKRFRLNFVSKEEVKHWPFIGLLAYSGGTIFVKREKASSAKKYIEDIQKAIKSGSNILVFPEGTTSRGDSILPFYSTLFQAPLISESKILPVYIQYYKFNGKKVQNNPALMDSTSWYGDMTLLPHLKKVLFSFGISVRLFYGDVIETTKYEKTSKGRKQLSKDVQMAIEKLKENSDKID